MAVLVEYEVPVERTEAFLSAMIPLGRSRRRVGARRWDLLRDGGEAGRFVESYLVASWGEHVLQESRRWTRADKRIKDAAEALAARPPTVRRLVAVDVSHPRHGSAVSRADLGVDDVTGAQLETSAYQVAQPRPDL